PGAAWVPRAKRNGCLPVCPLAPAVAQARTASRAEGHLGRSIRGMKGRFMTETCLLLGFQDLDCVNLHRPEHVRAKDNPLAVGRKRRIRLEAVIVLREVDQFLRTQMIAF